MAYHDPVYSYRKHTAKKPSRSRIQKHLIPDRIVAVTIMIPIMIDPTRISVLRSWPAYVHDTDRISVLPFHFQPHPFF